ncbi:MAG: T9SS type A sorting domain-containing protein [Bacteroidetes bacterium]|nr:T9SS type A sorting domain-containing protein [Bacteroidota bacterium]
MWCRTDRHDVYNVINDTLGILEILTDPTWTNVTPLNLHMDEIKAVKFDEGIVDLNVTIDSVIVYPFGSGIESMLDRTIRIYPNPVNSKLIIDGIPSDMKPFKIELTNLFGVKILESKITELNSGNSMALDCSGFPNGTYFIKISNSANNLVRKIILQH